MAVKSSEDLNSTRSIRHLLIKGADINIKVNKKLINLTENKIG